MSKSYSAGPQRSGAAKESFQSRFGDRLSVVNKDGSVSRVAGASGASSDDSPPNTNSPNAGRRVLKPSSGAQGGGSIPAHSYGKGPSMAGGPAGAVPGSGGYGTHPLVTPGGPVPVVSNGYASRGGTGMLSYGQPGPMTANGVTASGGGAMSLEDHMAQLNVLSDFISNPNALAPKDKVSIADLSAMPKVAASQDFVNGFGNGGPSKARPHPPTAPVVQYSNQYTPQVHHQNGMAQNQSTGNIVPRASPKEAKEPYQSPYGAFRERDGEYGVQGPAKKKTAQTQPRRLQSEPPAPERRPVRTEEMIPADEKLFFSKKPRKVDGHEPYHLGDYRKIKEDMQHFRAGGLGPDLESDEVRARRDKLERMKEYGRNTRYMMGDGELPAAPASKVPLYTDTTAKKMEQASEKRQKAMEYAKNVPRPKQAKKGPEAAALPDLDVVSPIDAMEAKHRRDQEQIEAIRREFG